METRKELMDWVNGDSITQCLSWYVNDLIAEYVRETQDYDGANEAWEIYAEREGLAE